MITLWIAAALLAAAAAALVVWRTAGAGPAAEDPALTVYRRQLAEIDELSRRELMPDDERRAARAETGRRLLAAADAPGMAATKRASPALIAVLAGLAPLGFWSFVVLKGGYAALLGAFVTPVLALWAIAEPAPG